MFQRQTRQAKPANTSDDSLLQEALLQASSTCYSHASCNSEELKKKLSTRLAGESLYTLAEFKEAADWLKNSCENIFFPKTVL